MVKKLQVGELFAVEEGPVKQEESGVTRVKGKTLQDEKVPFTVLTTSKQKTAFFCMKKVRKHNLKPFKHPVWNDVVDFWQNLEMRLYRCVDPHIVVISHLYAFSWPSMT